MNLRVDLILDTERRSALPVTFAFAVRLGALIAISLVVLLCLAFVKKYNDVNRDLRWAQDNLRASQSRYENILALKTSLAWQKSILAEFESWEQSRIPWHRLLRALQNYVPPTIQLTELRVDRVIKTIDKKPARVFKLQLKGKATTARADLDVDKLRNDILHSPAFANLLQDVEIPPGSFKQDPNPQAAKSDRLFELVCNFIPQVLE
jgi:Tfp pilus assembly protein PilN